MISRIIGFVDKHCGRDFKYIAIVSIGYALFVLGFTAFIVYLASGSI